MLNLLFYVFLGFIIIPIIVVFVIGLEQGWKGAIKWEDEDVSSGRWIDGK
jgi:ABC-type spermidine/putrescine transport system permease subunit II